MYTIVMGVDKTLTVTHSVTLYEKETGIDCIRWLIPPQYVESQQIKNLADYIVTVKIKCPDNRIWIEQLTCEDTPYKGRLDFRQVVTSDLTKVAGRVMMHLTFAKVIECEDGTKKPDIFHSENVYIDIERKEEFIFIPDKSLQAIDQLILTLSDKINQVNSMVEEVSELRANDIEMIDGEIYAVYKDPETGEITPLGDSISGASHAWSEI